ncbi:MobV family relaxase [Bacillus suaedae]|uniref:Plasmid recombination protein n=1 Tax=Halalkalibacter suaedae TaxID=2822140 RepID=A0A941AR92_9BACI|nr:MobV family relaxase [Bacillus suaedae]MBP3953681.1 plasmid recombination protein [Bacillus suaedae]
MSFAIIRMKKMKESAIKGIQFHNQREKESQTNPDIDESRSHQNYDLINPGHIDYKERIDSMIQEGVTTGKAVRKDAVRLASFLVTSDSTFFDKMSESEEKRFFETAKEFLADRYGEKNIAYAVVHKDEKTPHMHVGFVPITEDGRLSAKDFFGKKMQLVELQNDYHKHMNEKGFDLERGVSSDRKNIETSRFKALTAQDQLKELEAEFKDGVEQLNILDRDIQERKIILAGQLETSKLQQASLEKAQLQMNRFKHRVEKLQVPLREIEAIKGKAALGTVVLKKDEFESLKGMARKGTMVDDLQEQVKGLKRENNDLRRQNLSRSDQVDELQSENRELKKEASKFKSLYQYSIKILEKMNVWDRVKEMFEKAERAFDQKPQKTLEKEMDLER